jgi:hypothetical protein
MSNKVIYNVGVLEYWSNEIEKAASDLSHFPTLHHSNTPVLQKE